MDFVEDDKWRRPVMAFDLLKEKRMFQQADSILGIVPVHVEAVDKSFGNHLGQGRFPALAGAGQEKHGLFCGEVLPGFYVQGARFHATEK